MPRGDTARGICYGIFPFLSFHEDVIPRTHNPFLKSFVHPGRLSLSSLFFIIPLTMRCLFAILSFIAAACALQILTPNSYLGWTTAGPNVVTWSYTATDQLTYQMILVNFFDEVRTLPLNPSSTSYRSFLRLTVLPPRRSNPQCSLQLSWTWTCIG